MKKFFLISVLVFSSFWIFAQQKFNLSVINYPKFEHVATHIVENTHTLYTSNKAEPVQELIKAFPNLAKIKQNKPLCYQDVAFIAMQSIGIRGGIFYSLFKTKHYAFKELQYLEIIDKNIDPNKKISGNEALNIITECITYYEGNQ